MPILLIRQKSFEIWIFILFNRKIQIFYFFLESKQNISKKTFQKLDRIQDIFKKGN